MKSLIREAQPLNFNRVKTMNSKEKLAQALEQYKHNHTDLSDDLTKEQIEGINQLIKNALNGDYSDYDSKKHDLPQNAFVTEWDALGLPLTNDSIRYRMTQGEFDATEEESDAWYEREGKKIIEEEIPPSMRYMFERPKEETEEISECDLVEGIKNTAEFLEKSKEEKEAKEGIKGWDI